MGVHLWMFCCSLGMTPGSLNSSEELKCLLREFTKSRVTFLSNSTLFLVNYFDQELRREFSSCPDKRALPAQLWATAQPDNAASAQACVALSLQTTKQTAGFDDVNCMDKFYAMCQARSYMFANVNEISTKHGVLVNCDRKDILLSKQKMPAISLWKFCCSFGMSPASIETKEQISCIYDAYKNSSSVFSQNDMTFLTGYIDAYMNRSFVLCPNYDVLPDELWMLDEPDNKGGMENAVALNFGVSRNKVGLEDVRSIDLYNVLCQEENEIRSLTTMSTTSALQQFQRKLFQEPQQFSDDACMKLQLLNKTRNCKFCALQTQITNITKALQLSLKFLKANKTIKN